MPKATLEFNLPEENEEFKIATSAINYLSALIDIDQMLRSWDKHGLPNDMEEMSLVDLIERIRGRVLDIIQEYSIDLY